MMMMTMIMSTGWDYVSELRPSPGLLLIPQMVYEHGEPWWNDIDKLYFPSEERRAADFITLKIYVPPPCLNPRTVGQMTSTLTIISPRTTIPRHANAVYGNL
jgi:hypothetical protein